MKAAQILLGGIDLHGVRNQVNWEGQFWNRECQLQPAQKRQWLKLCWVDQGDVAKIFQYHSLQCFGVEIHGRAICGNATNLPHLAQCESDRGVTMCH